MSDIRLRLAELADEVVADTEKVPTKDGSAYVAIIDARKLVRWKWNTTGWSYSLTQRRGSRTRQRAGSSAENLLNCCGASLPESDRARALLHAFPCASK
jgi:hypothetical protein